MTDKERFIQEVMLQMLGCLDNAQLKRLDEAMKKALSRVKIVEAERSERSDDSNDNEEIVKKFVSAKKIEGCSDKTLAYYKMIIDAMTATLEKDVRRIGTEDLRDYLTDYQKKNNSSRVTIDNMRRILSSFFSWLEDEDYIVKSPMRRIHKIKTALRVKETYSDDDLERMRDNCSELRNLAMLDLLVSTGMRIGEMVLLNREDVNFAEREIKVFGKGDKERIVYFDARTKLHLQKYLSERADKNPALFVTLRAPHERIQIGGVETLFRKMGRRLNMAKVHPHKFRRTLATMAIDKGMPIEQLQQLLGHKRIDTTLHYAMVKQSNVKTSYRKNLG